MQKNRKNRIRIIRSGNSSWNPFCKCLFTSCYFFWYLTLKRIHSPKWPSTFHCLYLVFTSTYITCMHNKICIRNCHVTRLFILLFEWWSLKTGYRNWVLFDTKPKCGEKGLFFYKLVLFTLLAKMQITFRESC